MPQQVEESGVPPAPARACRQGRYGAGTGDLVLASFKAVATPHHGTTKHENRGADFPVCWQARKPAPHTSPQQVRTVTRLAHHF
jgi:hypothetical protein